MHSPPNISSLLILAIALAFADSRAADEIPDSDCLMCHEDQELTKTDEDGNEFSMYVDAAVLLRSSHATNTCMSCHTDVGDLHPDEGPVPGPVDCARCHAEQTVTYQASIHGLALEGGDAAAPTCVDCHGNHSILPPRSPASPLHRSHLIQTCGGCHPDEANELQESVHGQAVAQGLRDPPTCLDCHAEHRIESLRTGSPLKVAEQLCSRCHASERISTKYHLPADRVTSFFESYHGLAIQLGSTRAANCASCHGVHSIFPSSDPRSMVHPANLVNTCGACHTGASQQFVQGRVHLDDTNGNDTGSLVNRWVRRFYVGLIVLVVGLMTVHNALAWWRKAMRARQGRGPTVLRMSLSQRTQHLTLLLSFVVLAVSGLALAYPHSALAWLFGSDETIRLWVHRGSGVVLLAVGFYHLLYVCLTREGRRLIWDLKPEWKDLNQASMNVRHIATGTSPAPRIGRFGYVEKMEYWAVVWGSVIMGTTGLMIWGKLTLTEFLPRWVVEVAITVHFYEAILAILAIIVWHLYHVMFDPGVYPMNWAWWDGKVSEAHYRKEHPLDTESARADAESVD